MNHRSAIRNAAHQQEEAQRRLIEAVAAAYGNMPVGEIAQLVGVTRPTVYAMLREAGVPLMRPQRVK